jgi:hypothetical protein
MTNSEAIERFSGTAGAYCALIESCGSAEPAGFYSDCFRLIARLLSEAPDLPDIGTLNATPRVSHEEYSQVVDRLKSQVGDAHYKLVFDPWDIDPAPLLGSIWDDLADIWADLRHGLDALNRGQRSNAVCEWRFSFHHHWGPNHATHLLRPLFSLAYAERYE